MTVGADRPLAVPRGGENDKEKNGEQEKEPEEEAEMPAAASKEEGCSECPFDVCFFSWNWRLARLVRK